LSCIEFDIIGFTTDVLFTKLNFSCFSSASNTCFSNSTNLFNSYHLTFCVITIFLTILSQQQQRQNHFITLQGIQVIFSRTLHNNHKSLHHL